MSFLMSEEARRRMDAVMASPLYPQIQAMNRRLNQMNMQNNYRDPVGNPEYDRLKAELFALQDQAAGGSPTPNMSQPSPFGERQNNPYTRMGGLGGLMRRFDPRRMSGGFPGMFGRRGGGFGGMFGRRRPPPFFGGGQFGGRRPFPGMYRGMPNFMNRMGGGSFSGGMFGGGSGSRFDMRGKPTGMGRGRYFPMGGFMDRGGFGGGFRPPFVQPSRPPYNPIPQIDPDAFSQYRQRLDQRPPAAGDIDGPLSQDDIRVRAKDDYYQRLMDGANSPFGKPVFNTDGTIFQQSNAPQIPQELIDAQLSSVQQGPPIAGGAEMMGGGDFSRFITPEMREALRSRGVMGAGSPPPEDMRAGIGGLGGMRGEMGMGRLMSTLGGGRRKMDMGRIMSTLGRR
jgi:hypothetical protein